MDLDKLEINTEQASPLVLKDPRTFLDTDMTVMILSSDSEAYRQIEKKKHQATLDRASRGKRLKLDADDEYDEDTRKLIECTVAWSGFTYKGEPMECTLENKRAVYTNPRLRWIREQVKEHQAERGNFL